MPRWAEWAIVIASLVYALLYARYEWGGTAAYVLGILPAALTYFVARSLFAAAFVFLLPMYFVIGQLTAAGPHHQPYTWLDHAMPLWPAWIFVYGTLYLCAFVVPLLVVRGEALVRQTFKAYLFVMLVSYAVFWWYPTIAPRADLVTIDGPAEWTLQFFYDLDQPYGCFPSLHVAYSFVGAVACHRVNRKVGTALIAWAVLVGISTVYTKQHFAVDAVAGGALGILAWWLFLRSRVSR